MKVPESFSAPIYVTRPFLCPLKEMEEKLQEIWQSRWLTNNGPQHQRLEKMLAEKLKTPYLSLFNNGTMALLAACRILSLSGEVITTPFTFAATPHVLDWSGLTPVFCDIEADSFNIDPAKIEALITPRTSAILGVHVFGKPCNVTAIENIAKKQGLKVIYDAAHAFGVEIENQGIGTLGDITMFSFHATKLFHTVEGGALTFKENILKTKADYAKNFGIKNEEEIETTGINGKMNEIQAALGLINLKYYESECHRQQALYEVYKKALDGVPGISLQVIDTHIKNSYQYCIIRVNQTLYGLSRDELYTALKKFNIFSRKYFFPLCSNFDCYKDLNSAHPSRLPVANQVAQEILALPFYGELSLSEAAHISEIIRYLGKPA